MTTPLTICPGCHVGNNNGDALCWNCDTALQPERERMAALVKATVNASKRAREWAGEEMP